jgi:aldehyde:ferredoxin oxidoreductase
MLNLGYAGKYLIVDLSTKKYEIVEPSEKELREYVGCCGFAVKWLWDNTPAKSECLTADQPLIFATGPIAGTLCPSGGSYELCFKSPLTGAWCQARSGGSFGPKLKYAGFDHLIVKGQSELPVYLYIHDNQVEFRDASHLWGHGVEHTTTVIHNEVGDLDASVAAIGQGGENLVRFAAVINDRGRAAGRGGGGTVMGSKKLKAVVVNGKQDIKIANPEAFASAITQAEENLSKYPFEGINQFGTPLLIGIQNANGSLPTKNFRKGVYEDADKIGGELFTDKYLIKRRACYGCSAGCGRYAEVEDGLYKTAPMEGPEYETLNTFGSLSENSNIESIIHCNYLCNDYGLDTISAGAVISFAIDCYESGVISKTETGGMELKWGDDKTIVALLHDITNRKGLGDILAEGSKRAAERFGPGAKDLCLEIKGMEVPAHEPRGESKTLAIQYAVNPRGACHMHPNWGAIWDSGKFECGMNDFGQPWPPTDKYLELDANKGKAYRYVAIQGEISEIVGACVFHSWGAADECLTPALYARIISALTGWDLSKEELFKAADRSWVLKRCFNFREGFTVEDDDLPSRLKEELPEGPAKGQKIGDIKGLLQEYFKACGWDEKTGIPLKETLEDLNLGFVIPALPK